MIFNLFGSARAIALHLFVVFTTLLNPTVCLARETYVQASARLAAQAISENLVRADLEAELFRLTNEFRASKGLRALRVDNTMRDDARAHALDMLQQGRVGHVASTGHDFDSRMNALKGGPMVMPVMGENAARVSKPGDVNAAMAGKLFQQWVNSAPHRKALLSRDFVKLAVGAVSKGGQLYADQIFTGPEVQTNMGRVVPEESGSIY